MKNAIEAGLKRSVLSQYSLFAPLAFLLLAVAYPLITNAYWIDVGTSILTYAILGLGLNIVVGFAGLLDLGYAAFFAIGAYTSALLITKAGFNLWETLPFSMIMAAIAGAVLGYPTLRLRSDYLAIVTLGFGEIVRITATNLSFTGGPDGIWGIPKPVLFGFMLSDNASLYYLALVLLVITLVFTHTLTKSRLGRAWLSLREDESASEAVGVPSVRVKLLAYVLGATWAGLAGAFFASRLGAINPQSFTYMQSVLILMVVVLGGMASAPGVLLGAAVVAGLPELLRSIQTWRLFAFAIGLIVLMLLRPQGLLPAARRIGNPFAKIPPSELEETFSEVLRKQTGSQPQTAREHVSNHATASQISATGTAEYRVQAGAEDVILEVSHLECRFGGIKAVDDVSFRVPRGSILSIIGPNGAGKTTIFNCVTGVIRPNGGNVYLNGKSLIGMSPHQVVEAGLARTFQGIRLFKGMAVYENVLVGMFPRQRSQTWEAMLRTRKQRREERDALKAAYAWLKFCGIEEHAGSLAGELSYGDQRRLEIARALASQPKVLLLDEPAAGMNPTEKLELMSLVQRIRDLGITVILIEHDMNFVMSVSDRVVVIDRGVKIADDVPAAVQSDPRVIEAYLGQEELAEDDLSAIRKG